MPGQSQVSKGNPATKRMMNAALKARRAASWLRGQKRKDARRAEQARREAVNRELRAQGLPTVHEAKKEARRVAKHKV